MEPLRPDEKKRILADRPQATPQDLAEYEQLLSMRFAVDPSVEVPVAKRTRLVASVEDALSAEPPPVSRAVMREIRLKELHDKLFSPLHERESQ